MRNFHRLDTVTVDQEAGTILLEASDRANSLLVMRREGEYVAISASHGPFEIALRPRYQELARTFSRLQRIEGLQTTTRQVGTAQAYLAVGLSADGMLILRPTIVADATGHLNFNLLLTDEARSRLFSWLGIDN